MVNLILEIVNSNLIYNFREQTDGQNSDTSNRDAANRNTQSNVSSNRSCDEDVERYVFTTGKVTLWGPTFQCYCTTGKIYHFLIISI